MNFPSPSSSFFEHSKQLAFYIYAQMRLSLWVQSPEKTEAYSLGCQRKQLLARFSCPGNRYSSRSFGLTAKANICITFIFPSSLPHLCWWNQQSWAFSEGLLAIPCVLNSKLSANQDCHKTMPQNTASLVWHQLSRIPESASLGKPFSVVPAEPKSYLCNHHTPHMRFCPDLLDRKGRWWWCQSSSSFGSGLPRWEWISERPIRRLCAMQMLVSEQLNLSIQPDQLGWTGGKRLHYPSPEVYSSFKWSEWLFTTWNSSKGIWRKLFLLFRQIVPFYLILCNVSSDNNLVSVKKKRLEDGLLLWK